MRAPRTTQVDVLEGLDEKAAEHMGKVEKIAVLTVLFLIALILVVSMTTDNPLDKGRAALLGEQPNAKVASNDAAQTPTQSPAPAPANKLLSATITPEQAPAVATPPPAAPAALVLPPRS